MVDELFSLILNRRLGNDKEGTDHKHTAAHWIRAMLGSDEFAGSYFKRFDMAKPSKDYITDASFRTPRLQELELPSDVLLTGNCLMGTWPDTLARRFPGVNFHYEIYNNGSELADMTDQELGKFAFQIAQIPLRAIVYDSEIYDPSYSPHNDEYCSQLFELSAVRLQRSVDALLKYNRQTGMRVFVMNFTAPQANPTGFLLPRYHLSNISYYVEELNKKLYEFISGHRGVHLLDFDSIASSLGKRYVNDDITSQSNHGAFLYSLLGKGELELTPYGEFDDIFRPKLIEATVAIFNECVNYNYIASPTSKIKIVVFDLDGTLWRGIPAEAEHLDPHGFIEGWPLAMIEAVSFLRKRGIILAIASKNDHQNVERIWNTLYGKAFPLNNFSIVKASWGNKATAVQEILAEANLLAESCLFVDDNPVERDLVSSALPGISVIEGPVSTWRRTLLWSAELQTASLTAESANRAESIQAIAAREKLKTVYDHDEYIKNLNVQTQIDVVTSAEDQRFTRLYELLNKTNQFNTTAERWTESQTLEWLADGGQILAATVSDRMSDYGLTALALIRGDTCMQMVMSCRVFGLGVEDAILRRITEICIANGRPKIAFRRTEKNGPAATFLTKLGIKTAREPGDEIAIYDIP